MKILKFFLAAVCLVLALGEFYLWCKGFPITGITHRLTVAIFALGAFLDLVTE